MESEFERLKEKLESLARLSQIKSLLGWDEQVNLPANSAESRGHQLATISEVIHSRQTDPELGSLLDILKTNSSALTEDQNIVVADAYKDFKEGQSLTTDFVTRHANAISQSYHAWAEAHETGDFKTFAPHLQKQIDLAKEYASLCGAEDAYDFCIDKHDPGMDAQTISDLFGPLKAGILPIVAEIEASEKKIDPSILKGFPADAQERFLKAVIEKLGFDFTRGRIDRSIHPFCSGSGQDIRMTTRFFEDNPLDSLFSSIHEAGHGMYEQGLSSEWQGTALGIHAGMGAHESQSRLWENQIARSAPFWEYWESSYRAAFPEQLSKLDSDALYRAINAVKVIPIRVDSDEVTYNLHIMLRFQLEKDLFSGELEVNDLPEAWNTLAKEYLGLELESDKEGCLQDVHWSTGSFGYFPSYTLGNMLAAQLWYRLREDLSDVDASISTGNFDTILHWLRTHVHTHGRKYPLLQLSQEATGQALNSKALIRYLEDRYLPLYR